VIFIHKRQELYLKKHFQPHSILFDAFNYNDGICAGTLLLSTTSSTLVVD
jgi:hypothetical protein